MDVAKALTVHDLLAGRPYITYVCKLLIARLAMSLLVAEKIIQSRNCGEHVTTCLTLAELIPNWLGP